MCRINVPQNNINVFCITCNVAYYLVKHKIRVSGKRQWNAVNAFCKFSKWNVGLNVQNVQKKKLRQIEN